jgi:UPF0755 protein
MANKNKSLIKKILLWFVFLLALAGSIAAYIGYKMVYTPNTTLQNKQSEMINIPTRSTFEDVLKILSDSNLLKNKESFIRIAKLKKYVHNVKPGRYRITANMSNDMLINHLRAGMQEPVFLTFTNIRKKEQLVSVVCKKIEADSTELLALLNNDSYLKENLGIKSEAALTLFIPNTYNFKWNTSAKKFLQRMQTEYKKFWSAERRSKAKQIGLSPTQVSILASIVQAEQQQYKEERPVIAGLYLNRLKLGIPLQSDPTVVYALDDFAIKRVLDKQKAVDSPYNTYQHTGLPPGPIYLPEISSIDAVLNYQKNNYIYMCAKEDFSGKHNFASTLAQHNRNAERYRAALNRYHILH